MNNLRYLTHTKRITRTAAKTCRLSYQDCEDAIQMTLIEVWKHRETASTIQNYDAWLYVVAYRICLRLKATTGRDLFLEDLPQSARAQILEALDKDSRSYACCKQIGELLDAEIHTIRKQIASMHYRDGMPTKRISEQLEIPLNTVLSHLHRFRDSLRQKFRD